MRMAKIALWVFIAFLISGVLFGISFLSDVNRLGGWDKVVFGIGTQYSVNDIKETNLASIKRIEINVSSADTTLVASGEQTVKAALTGEVRTTNPKAVPYLQMNVSGDTLRITEVRHTQFSFGFYSSTVKLEVSIPSQFSGELAFNSSSGNLTASDENLSSLKIQTSSGDIVLGNVDLAGDFKFSTSSGQLDLGNLKAVSAEFSSSSGDRKINNLEISGEAVFETSSGTTDLKAITAGKASFQSSSGDFTIGQASASQTTVRTSSGKADFGSLEGNADVSTSSGDVSIVFTKVGSQISISTSSGYIKLGLPQDAQFALNASTSSGDIQSNFELDNVKADKKSLRGTKGNAETKIDLSTSGGDITINKN